MNHFGKKSLLLQRLEQQIKLKELTRNLETELRLNKERKQIAKPQSNSLSAQRGIDIDVWLSIIGLALLLAVGAGWMLVYFSS